MAQALPELTEIQHTKYDFANSLYAAYVSSVLSAYSAELVTYPLDLMKTRLQVQGESRLSDNKSASPPRRNLFQTAYGVATEEGVLKLWKGISAVFVRHSVYSGSRMVIYRLFREKVFHMKPGERFSFWQAAVSGASAGALAQFLASPADLIKTQLQMEGKRKLLGLPPRVTGFMDAYHKVIRAGGYTSLWKGAIPNTYRAALVNLGDFAAYDVSKRFFLRNTSLEDTPMTHVMCSLIAGFAAAVMGTPADVIKTRVMNQPVDGRGRGLTYSSSTDCLIKTLKNEGGIALYKGFLPHWMRLGPWALIFWMTYEQIMKTVGARQF